MKTLRFIVGAMVFSYVISGLMLGMGIVILAHAPTPTFNWGMYTATLFIFGISYAMLAPIIIILVFKKSVLLRQAEYDAEMNKLGEQRRKWTALNAELSRVIVKQQEKQ